MAAAVDVALIVVAAVVVDFCEHPVRAGPGVRACVRPCVRVRVCGWGVCAGVCVVCVCVCVVVVFVRVRGWGVCACACTWCACVA